MEIQALKLFLTDADLVALAEQTLRQTEAIEELAAHFTPEGVIIAGEYPTGLFKVAFETLWHVHAGGPEVHVRLAAVKVAGLPAGMMRGVLMKMVRDAIDGEKGLRVHEDAIIVHVHEAARARGVDLRVHFTSVRLSIGAAVIEAG